MTKNIVIVILLFCSGSLFVYALYQQTEARRQEALAKENAEMAVNMRRQAEAARAEAEIQRDAALAARADAENQRTLPEEHMKNCEEQLKMCAQSKQRKANN